MWEKKVKEATSMDPRGNCEELFVDTIKEIHLAIKNIASYPEEHPATRESICKSHEALTNLLSKQTTLTVSVDGNKLLVDDVPVDSRNMFSAKFALDLEKRAIDSITFCRGLSERDFMTFLNAMIERPIVLSQEDGVASILQQHGISTIKLNEIKYGRISEKSKDLGLDERKRIRDDVTRLLSEGNNDEVQKILKDLFKKLGDASWRARKKVAESLLDITCVLGESDKLR